MGFIGGGSALSSQQQAFITSSPISEIENYLGLVYLAELTGNTSPTTKHIDGDIFSVAEGVNNSVNSNSTGYYDSTNKKYYNGSTEEVIKFQNLTEVTKLHSSPFNVYHLVRTISNINTTLTKVRKDIMKIGSISYVYNNKTIFYYNDSTNAEVIQTCPENLIYNTVDFINPNPEKIVSYVEFYHSASTNITTYERNDFCIGYSPITDVVIEINEKNLSYEPNYFIVYADVETTGTGNATLDITYDGVNYQEGLSLNVPIAISNLGSNRTLKINLNAGESSGIATISKWGIKEY